MSNADGVRPRATKHCVVCDAMFSDRPSRIASRFTCSRACDGKRKTQDETTIGEYLEARYIPEPNSGCWLWIGTQWGGGYGMAQHAALRARRGRSAGVVAHRAVYEHLRGPVQIGLVLDHLCRNKACVNPDHLEPVTQAENMRRGAVAQAGAALQSAKTHCPQGHLYSDDNTYRTPAGHRQCRVCKSEASRRRFREGGGR